MWCRSLALLLRAQDRLLPRRAKEPETLVPRLQQGLRGERKQLVPAGHKRLLQVRRRGHEIGVRTTLWFGDYGINDLQLQQVGRSYEQRLGGPRRRGRVAPEDHRAALGADDRVVGVF